MARPVQFRGMDQVLKAYDSRNTSVWSIWCEKDYLTKGEGRDMLRNFLEMLDDNGSKVVYKLKVYEDKTVAEVKERTESDGSFSFILIDGEFDEYENSRYVGVNNKMYRELQELKKSIQGQQSQPETIGQIGMEILRNPADALQWVNVFRAITGQTLLQIPNEVAAIGSINEQDKNERAAAAIDTLERNDPGLVVHLEKLADMSAKDPANFKILLGLLDAQKK